MILTALLICLPPSVVGQGVSARQGTYARVRNRRRGRKWEAHRCIYTCTHTLSLRILTFSSTFRTNSWAACQVFSATRTCSSRSCTHCLSWSTAKTESASLRSVVVGLEYVESTGVSCSSSHVGFWRVYALAALPQATGLSNTSSTV